jgi:hypothetical protein
MGNSRLTFSKERPILRVFAVQGRHPFYAGEPLSRVHFYFFFSRRADMKRLLLLSALIVLCIGISSAQNWSRVWKMANSPYLTLSDITELGIVKAGFDTDQDGWGEILCAWTDLDTNAILMYEATGNNTYKLVWSWVYPVDANTFAGIAVGDLNDNGRVDIVTTMPTRATATDPSPTRLWVFEWNGVVGENAYGFLNSSTGTYDPSASWNFECAANYDLRPYSLTIEDIDGDSTNELIVGMRVGGASNREVIVASVDGDYGGFYNWHLEWKYSHAFGGSNYSVTTGDLDHDGHREIYMFVWDLFTMRIFECMGDGQYTEAFAVDQLYSDQGIDYGALDAVRVTDVNHDGANEMYIAGTEPENKVFIVTGVTDVSTMTSANIKELFTMPISGGGKLRSMYVADPDKDGKADLIIAGETNGTIFSLEYNGTGNPADSSSWTAKVLFDIFAESGLTTISPRLFYAYPAKDMDKDGKDEIAFVNYSPDFDAWPDDSPLWLIEVDVASDVHDAPSGVPSQVKLLQNYPNPFNPSTSIGYEVAGITAQHVRLAVYDVLGKEVAVLVDGQKAPGAHTATWNARGMASGVYVCRLTSGEYSEGKKMMLLQ